MQEPVAHLTRPKREITPTSGRVRLDLLPNCVRRNRQWQQFCSRRDTSQNACLAS